MVERKNVSYSDSPVESDSRPLQVEILGPPAGQDGSVYSVGYPGPAVLVVLRLFICTCFNTHHSFLDSDSGVTARPAVPPRSATASATASATRGPGAHWQPQAGWTGLTPFGYSCINIMHIYTYV